MTDARADDAQIVKTDTGYQLTFTFVMNLGPDEVIEAVGALLEDTSLNYQGVTFAEARTKAVQWWPNAPTLLEELRKHMPGNLGANSLDQGDVLWYVARYLVRLHFPELMRGYVTHRVADLMDDLTKPQEKALRHMQRTRTEWVRSTSKVVGRALVRKGLAECNKDETMWRPTEFGREWLDAHPAEDE